MSGARMAITEDAPGVTVDILIDGQALHEYYDDNAQDEAETPSHSSCYVEAQSGKLFEVRAHVKRGTQHLGDQASFRVLVDGRYIDKITMYASEWKTKDASKCNYGRELSSGMVQRYCFVDLKTSDDAAFSQLPLAAQVKDLGIIRVELHYKQTAKSKNTRQRNPVATSAFAVVSEKVLKGQSMSHSVELKSVHMGPPKSRTSRSSYVDAMRKPTAIYNFHYRSRASLQSMLLIPRTPSPAPLEERDPNSMSRDELLQLVTQQGLVKTGISGNSRKIKRERSESPPTRQTARRRNEIPVIELDENGDVKRETMQPAPTTYGASGPITID